MAPPSRLRRPGFPPPPRIGLRPIRACHLGNRSRVGVAVLTRSPACGTARSCRCFRLLLASGRWRSSRRSAVAILKSLWESVAPWSAASGDRCLDRLDMDATLIAVIEMSQSSWLVAGIVPGVEREPLKKLAIDEHALLNLLRRWRAEAEKQGHRITRIAVAFEAGPDGFWLARWLAAHGVE